MQCWYRHTIIEHCAGLDRIFEDSTTRTAQVTLRSRKDVPVQEQTRKPTPMDINDPSANIRKSAAGEIESNASHEAQRVGRSEFVLRSDVCKKNMIP